MNIRLRKKIRIKIRVITACYTRFVEIRSRERLKKTFCMLKKKKKNTITIRTPVKTIICGQILFLLCSNSKANTNHCNQSTIRSDAVSSVCDDYNDKHVMEILHV